MTRQLLVLGLCLASSAPASATPAQSDSAFAVRAKELWLGEGQRVDGGVLLVEGGKIRAAGRGVDVPSGASLIEHDGVVSAGLIAYDCAIGLEGEDSEAKRSVLAEGRVVDALDASDPRFADLLREGITAVVIQPAPGTLAGGRGAVVKTAHRTVLAAEAFLALSLSDQALDPNRSPTSPSGAMSELHRLLSAREGPLGAAAGGREAVLVQAPERDDVRRALELAARHGLKGALLGVRRSDGLVEAIEASGLAAVVGPFGAGAAALDLRSVVALGEARVPLAFALEAPARHPASLRLSAALCVREGLDPLTAWSALTDGAARIAGVAARAGRLERGLDADFVLWSGNPLDLSSRPVAVFVDGVRVWRRGDK